MTIAAPITVPIKNIQLTPGSMITIPDVSWEQFEAILAELGSGRSIRIAYSRGTLEIISPLPAHERPHRIIGYIVTTLLDAQERDWEDFGSTTFKQQQKAAGLEPDTCFYIQNAAQVRNCMRMDLAVYPPPDLAIEADITSKTTLEAYYALQVPEVWVYDSGKLTTKVFQDSNYIESATSLTFPNLPIAELIPKLFQQAFADGSSQMLRHLRKQITEGQFQV